MTAIGQRGTRHRFVTADGTALYVDVTGPENAPVTLVLVHAWTQDHTEWAPILPLLPTDVRVLRHDHRGHGASAPAKPGTATIAQLADDLAEVIADRAPEGRLVLAGHSLGGMTVMELAERHPELVRERVAGVAFIATSCSNMDRLTLGLRGPAGRAAIRADKALARMLSRYGKDSAPVPAPLARPATKWLAFGKKAVRADVRAMTDQVLRAHPSSIGGFRDSISRHDRREALATLAGKPGVIMVGDRDRLTPVPHARVIADELPGAEFVLFPGAGHELPYERKHGVAKRLTQLVDAARE
ncbi:pimeloyl-ACP methyl ester carboxylesterase [Amycolatopsis bartoniae]|uniref:Alpha/beta hydrolase n=1 Tax=Amycolatopsis bartoniae TaxID=941986 RepID=A0A8H9J4V5_9PSEU|nr:alpha/beta fold hydrolase [Amycolatopsis bartoniae]MBB2938896.1 pimeloyl-ACP methyl ester carboxylesterase [Amycolatopsis bartoniae]TVS99700.1 alpha/beta fold hydrolase [Amycolatopsis bartoniae]GHF77446.1 alpha/beta hydrolase [Amycolatopsis bartoniae]